VSFLEIEMKKTFLRFGVGSAAFLAGVSAFAADPATGLEAVQSLTTGQTGYGPVMFGLAIVSVGVMIGVKWIKRARGAA
jgi:hypothetical protein